ncbi:MAG: hypothetical protein IJF83_13725 [Methanobrevibacter sp.]|nr:hypothetical protein [Methanobrevibacter sp.]
MAGAIVIAILFVIVVCALCDGSSPNNAPKRNTQSQSRTTNSGYYRCSYDECPSCGAPGYDGYCEECGYPDINQGWIGENY